MTPKEKAKELIESFYKCMPFRDVKLTSCDETPELIIQMEKLSAKQCALIAVDEVQRLIKDLSSCNYRFIYIIDEMNFWNEVKQEVEKL
jgi:hypothetical protein